MVEGVVDLADRQADESDEHQHVAAHLVRDLERVVEDGTGEHVEPDHDEHDGDRRLAHDRADALHGSFGQAEPGAGGAMPPPLLATSAINGRARP